MIFQSVYWLSYHYTYGIRASGHRAIAGSFQPGLTNVLNMMIIRKTDRRLGGGGYLVHRTQPEYESRERQLKHERCITIRLPRGKKQKAKIFRTGIPIKLNLS